MPDEVLEELTEKFSRSFNMSVPTTSTNVVSGFNEVQMGQIKELISRSLNPSHDLFSDDEIDQPIGRLPTRLEELDKVPDVVRSLREFSGKPGEFNSWRKSVDRVLELYQALKGT